MSLIERFLDFFRRSEAAKPPHDVPEYELTGNYTGEDAADRRVFKQLRDAGCNLSEPRHVIHYLYFTQEDRSEKAATAIRAEGYEVQLMFSTTESEHPVLVKADRVGVVNEGTFFNERELLKSIAHIHGGIYDGWEAQQS